MTPYEYFIWKNRNDQRERFGALAQVVFPNVIKGLRPIARRLGYSLCTHGSMLRDCDLVACPWVIGSACPYVLIQCLREAIPGCMISVDDPEQKPNGRLAWELHFWCDDYLLTIDISVMPSV